MSIYHFELDGKKHTVDTDPPGCLETIFGFIVLAAIVYYVFFR